MAFGGAGIFLFLPLTAVINDFRETCLKRSGTTTGDIRIEECAIWNINTKLTPVRELYRMDLRGDLSGLLDSGHMRLSLHHWKEDNWVRTRVAPSSHSRYMRRVLHAALETRLWYDPLQRHINHYLP